jgi:hypothetical protein
VAQSEGVKTKRHKTAAAQTESFLITDPPFLKCARACGKPACGASEKKPPPRFKQPACRKAGSCRTGIIMLILYRFSMMSKIYDDDILICRLKNMDRVCN